VGDCLGIHHDPACLDLWLLGLQGAVLMRMSRKLLCHLAKFKGIDTTLFEHDVEWQLLDSVLSFSLTEADIVELEKIASTIAA
jgi:hypothetical protein